MKALEKIDNAEIGSLGDDTIGVDLWYCRNEPRKVVEVGLVDVRAADSVQISYDFDRDGWVIKQASTFSWEGDDPVCDSDWQEVAFVQAWERRVKEPIQVQLPLPRD